MPPKKRRSFKIPVRVLAKKSDTPVVLPALFEVKKKIVPTVVSSTKKVGDTSETKHRQNVQKQEWSELPKEKEKPLVKRKKVNPKNILDWCVNHWRLLVTVAVFAAVCVIGGEVLYERFVFPVGSATVVPSNALAFASINMSPWNSQVQEILPLLPKEDDGADSRQTAEDAILSQLSLSRELLRTYSEREISLSVLPSQVNGVSTVLIFGMSNQKKADAFLQTAGQTSALKITQYKGKNIYTHTLEGDTPDSSNGPSFVILPRYVVATPDKTTAFLVLDVALGDSPSLAQSATFRAEKSRVGLNPFAFFYSTTSGVAELSKKLPDIIPSQVLSLLPKDKTVGGSLFVRDHTLQFSLAVNGVGGSDVQGTTNLTSQLPRSTVFSAEGANFASQFKTLEASAKESDPLFAFYVNTTKKQLATNFNLNLETDLLPYVQSHYALALDTSSSRMKTTGKPFQNVSVLFQLSDAAGFADHEKQLQESILKILRSQFQSENIAFRDMPYAGMTLHALQSPDVPVDVYYTVYQDKLIVSTAKDIFGFLGGQTVPPLSSDESVRLALSKISGSGNRYYYVNVAQLISIYPQMALAQKVHSVVLRESRDRQLLQLSGTISFTP